MRLTPPTPTTLLQAMTQPTTRPTAVARIAQAAALACALGGSAVAQTSEPGKQAGPDTQLDNRTDKKAVALAAQATLNNGARFLPVNVRINGVAAGKQLLLDRDGVLYASVQAFEEWRVKRRTEAPAATIDGKQWYALASLAGAEVRLNFSEQMLDMSFVPGALGAPKPSAVATAAIPAAQKAAVATATPATAATLANSVASSAIAPTARAAAIPVTQTPAAAQKLAQSGTPLSPVVPQRPAAPAATNAAAAAAGRLMPLDVRINGASAGNWVLLERPDGLFATQDALQEWRLIVRDELPTITYRGQTWFLLSGIAGFQQKINQIDQSIDMSMAANAFAATRLQNELVAPNKASPATPALFVNYDLNVSHSSQTGINNITDFGALVELGASNDLGAFASSHVGRNLGGNSALGNREWIRLESSFTHNWPVTQTTLRLGDSSTRGAVGSRGVYFGGIQVGRNFALLPGFLTQPVPVIRGSATSPSSVELYVNDALRQTSNVPTGPFAIDNFPLFSNGGDVRIVVRDLLGRETVLVQPFANYGNLLEAGLSDWSFEVGALRQDLGTKSNNYGEKFGSGLWRVGFNKELTIEAGAQVSRLGNNTNLGAAIALPGQILGVVGLSASGYDGVGRGNQASAALEFEGFRHSFSSRIAQTTDRYRYFGAGNLSLPNKTEQSLSYQYRGLQNDGSLGVGLASIRAFDDRRIETFTVNYSKKLTDQGASIRLSATAVGGASGATSVGASLLIPLGSRLTSSSSVNAKKGATDAYTSVASTPDTEFGTGWRALVGSRETRGFAEAGAYRRTQYFDVTGDVAANKNSQTTRVGLQSALVLIDGDVYASRRVQDGFAVVEVTGYPGIGVKYNSVDAGKTNDKGRVFLPRLQPYQVNTVRIDPNELPIGAEIDTIEQTVVPAAKSGVKLSFPARAGRAALVKIVMADGAQAPAGAEVTIVGDAQEFFVARRGETFITGLQPTNRIRMKYAGGVCEFDLPVPKEVKTQDVLRLGPISCIGKTK